MKITHVNPNDTAVLQHTHLQNGTVEYVPKMTSSRRDEEEHPLLHQYKGLCIKKSTAKYKQNLVFYKHMKIQKCRKYVAGNILLFCVSEKRTNSKMECISILWVNFSLISTCQKTCLGSLIFNKGYNISENNIFCI